MPDTFIAARAPLQGADRETDLARDMARAGYLVRCRAWRHLESDFRGHWFAPLAMLSGAIADALLSCPTDLLWPAYILVVTHPPHREPVADILIALGGGHV